MKETGGGMRKLIWIFGLITWTTGLTGCAANGDPNSAVNASRAACRSVDFEPVELTYGNATVSLAIRFDNQTVTALENSSGCSRSLTEAEVSNFRAKAKSLATCSTYSGSASVALAVQNSQKFFGIDNPSASNVTVNGGYNNLYNELIALKNDVIGSCNVL
jgi:hypothetical protein